MTPKYVKFFPVVLAIANLSKDRSTKVGAIALGPEYEVLSVGYNGFPRGVDDSVDERFYKPLKYKYTSHAEENLVAQAARSGVSLYGATTLISTLYPCSSCTRMLIQAGIKRIITFNVIKNSNHWMEEFSFSKQMMDEAKVEFIEHIS